MGGILCVTVLHSDDAFSGSVAAAIDCNRAASGVQHGHPTHTHTHTGELCEQGARNSGLWHLFPATWRFWGRPGNPTHCRRIDPALSNEDCWGPTQMQKVCTKFSHCFSPTEFLFEYVNEFTTFVITPTELQDVWMSCTRQFFNDQKLDDLLFTYRCHNLKFFTKLI